MYNSEVTEMAPNKKSLENLKAKGRFKDKELARAAQLKGAEKKKEYNIARKAAIGTLAKKTKRTLNKTLCDYSFEEIGNMISSGDLKPMEFKELLLFLIDIAGYKPKDTPEAIVMPVINIKGL